MSTRAYLDNETNGATTLANTIDTELNKIRLDLRERLQQGGHFFASSPGTNPDPAGASENLDGRLAIGVEDDTHDNTGVLTFAWDHLATTAYGRFYGANHATAAKRLHAEFIDGIYLGTSGDKICHGIATASYTRIVIPDAVPVTGVVPILPAYKVPTGSPNRVVRSVGVVCRVRPSGGPLTANILKITAPVDTVDRYTSGSSLGTVSLAAGTDYSAFTTTGFGDVISANDELILKWDAVNGALDATCIIELAENT